MENLHRELGVFADVGGNGAGSSGALAPLVRIVTGTSSMRRKDHASKRCHLAARDRQGGKAQSPGHSGPATPYPGGFVLAGAALAHVW